MQTTLTSNLKVTTIWPELTNHRIQRLDLRLEEVQIENRGASLVVGGIILRKVICLNDRNQCRKVEDRLQFTTHLALPSESASFAESTSPIETTSTIEGTPPIFSAPSIKEASPSTKRSPSTKASPSQKATPPMGAGRVQLENLRLSDIELIQNGFMFQPGSGRDGPAVLEQDFTLVIRCPPGAPAFRRKALPIWTKLVIESGQGKMVLALPVGLLGPGQTPRHFTGAIHLQSPVHSPVIQGSLQGIITYCSRERELKELDFETAINFLLERPLRIQDNQYLCISGDLIGVKWRQGLLNGTPGEVMAGGAWRLEINFQYQWRVIEERELWIMAEDGREAPCLEREGKYAASIRLRKFDFQWPRDYEFSDWDFKPDEIKVRLEECRDRLTPAGILLSGKLCFEAFGIGAAGREMFQTQRTDFEELAPLPGIYLPKEEAPPEQLLTHLASTVELESFGFQKGIQQVGVLLKFEVSLYREQMITIAPLRNGGVPILACLSGEQREFPLEGEAALTLQVRPRRIIKLEVRPLEVVPKVNPGWIGIDGRMEVAVCFVDERFRYYETTYIPFFQGAFNWDKLQLHDIVKVQCRLNHYSHRCEGPKVFFRYWLTLAMENRRETEIMVETAAPAIKREMGRLEGGNLKEGPGRIDWKDSTRRPSGEDSLSPIGESAERIGGLEFEPQKQDWIPSGQNRRYLMAGEIPLQTGTVQEMGTSNITLSGVHLQPLKEGLIIEGVLRGTVEYWDPAGFLQRETVELSFWRLSQLHSPRKTLEFPRNQENLQLELLNVSITPIHPPFRGKSKVRVRFELILCQMLKKKSNV